MLLEMRNRVSDSVCTQAELYIDGMIQAYTLEPPNPIPPGTYNLTIYVSPHFGYAIPLLQNVPGHNYIEIHPGNAAVDTHGCILVGSTKLVDEVENSRIAFDALMEKIVNAKHAGEKLQISIPLRTQLT